MEIWNFDVRTVSSSKDNTPPFLPNGREQPTYKIRIRAAANLQRRKRLMAASAPIAMESSIALEPASGTSRAPKPANALCVSKPTRATAIITFALFFLMMLVFFRIGYSKSSVSNLCYFVLKLDTCQPAIPRKILARNAISCVLKVCYADYLDSDCSPAGSQGLAFLRTIETLFQKANPGGQEGLPGIGFKSCFSAACSGSLLMAAIPGQGAQTEKGRNRGPNASSLVGNGLVIKGEGEDQQRWC